MENSTDVSQDSSTLNNITLEVTDKLNSYEEIPLKETERILLNLLTDRKEILLDILENNATEAMQSILSFEDREKALPITKNCVEQPTTISGKLALTHIDSFEEGHSTEKYEIINGDDNKVIALHPAFKVANNLRPGMNLSISGYLLDSNLVFDDRLLFPNADPTRSETLRYSLPLTVQGNQNIAIILADFANTMDPNLNTSFIQDTVFNRLNVYYTINSGGRISLSGNTFGPYQLPSSSHCPFSSGETWDAHLTQVVSAAENDVYYPDYDRLIIIAPYSGSDCNSVNALTRTGSSIINTRDGEVNMTVAYVKSSLLSSSISLRIIGHELGHNFGMMHASGLDCRRSVFPPSADYSNDCILLDYGDPYDIMGGFGHLNGPHLEYLGWLSPSNIINVTANISDRQTFSLEPIERRTDGPKVLKIQRGDNDFLYVEYRQPLLFNETIGSGTDVFRGALFHLTLPSLPAGQTLLLDATPDSLSGGNFTTSVLRPRATLTDPESGIIIQSISANPNSLTVDIFR